MGLPEFPSCCMLVNILRLRARTVPHVGVSSSLHQRRTGLQQAGTGGQGVDCSDVDTFLEEPHILYISRLHLISLTIITTTYASTLLGIPEGVSLVCPLTLLAGTLRLWASCKINYTPAA